MNWRRRPLRLPQDLPSSLQLAAVELAAVEPDLMEQLAAVVSGNLGRAQVAPINWNQSYYLDADGMVGVDSDDH